MLWKLMLSKEDNFIALTFKWEINVHKMEFNHVSNVVSHRLMSKILKQICISYPNGRLTEVKALLELYSLSRSLFSPCQSLARLLPLVLSLNIYADIILLAYQSDWNFNQKCFTIYSTYKHTHTHILIFVICISSSYLQVFMLTHNTAWRW